MLYLTYALNRDLYHLQMPRSGGRPKKELPFKAEYRHHYWFVLSLTLF